MKVGLSTACLYLREYTEDAISTIKSLKAECAEIFLGTFYEYRPEFAKAYAKRGEGLNMDSLHVCTGNYEPQLFNRSRRVKGDGFYWLDQVMRSAQIFGCKNYTFHGIFRKGTESNDYAHYAERLAEIDEFCMQYGIRVSLENVAWSTYNKVGVFGEIKKIYPNLSGVFDIKQARNSGCDYKEYIKEMGESISHVHLSDVDENGKMCLPGRGKYNFNEIIKALKGVGFDKNILIEVYPSDYKEISELKESLEFLKETVYKNT